MPELASAAGADVPQVFRQVFPDAVVRLADPTDYKAIDINKIAVQLDTGEQYRLASIGPTVWVLITGTGSARLTPLWKGGTPGDPFVDTDTVSPTFGDRVMFTAPSGDVITFELPPITAANAGQRIGFYDVTFAAKSIGDVNFVPDGTDSIGGHPAGATRKLDATGIIGPWLELESDGNDTWTVVVGLVLNSTFDSFVA